MSVSEIPRGKVVYDENSPAARRKRMVFRGWWSGINAAITLVAPVLLVLGTGHTLGKGSYIVALLIVLLVMIPVNATALVLAMMRHNERSERLRRRQVWHEDLNPPRR